MRTQSDGDKLTIFLDGRIDTGNAPRLEAELFAAIEGKDAAPVLDAEQLEYISSAGLRVLMKLRKRYDQPITVVNVSRDVYDIFETTGFTDLLNVKKALRKISVEGLEPIGEGATAKVYRLDQETIVKVFLENISFDLMIGKEIGKARNAFVSGVPTAIPYDIVRVGNCYGTVYELLSAKDLGSILISDKEHRDEYVQRFAGVVREMHQIEADTAVFDSLKARSLMILPRLEGVVCSKEEIEKLRLIYENLPDRNTFIHGDCHPGNVMLQGDEMMFIDLSSSGSGHPIFDMMSMCQMYHINAASENARKRTPILRGLSPEEAEHIWRVFLKSYLDTEDEALIAKAEEQIVGFSCARMLFAALALPGIVSEEAMNRFKMKAIQYVEKGLEPICF